MHPKIGDFIIDEKGLGYTMVAEPSDSLKGVIARVRNLRGTDTWRPIHVGDYVVLKGNHIHKITEFEDGRYYVANGTFFFLSDVEYIAYNEFDLSVGDFVEQPSGWLGRVEKDANGELRILRAGMHRPLSKEWKRAPEPPIHEVANGGKVEKAFYHRGAYYYQHSMNTMSNPKRLYDLELPNRGNGNKTQKLKAGDFVVTNGGVAHKVLEVNRVHRTIKPDVVSGFPLEIPWADLKYITINKFDRILGDFVDVRGKLGRVASCGSVPNIWVDGMQECNPKSQLLTAPPPKMKVLTKSGLSCDVYEYKGNFYLTTLMSHNPTAKRPIDFCGRWYLVKGIPMFCKDVKQTNNPEVIQFVCQRADGMNYTLNSPEVVCAEQLEVKDQFLVGKNAVWDLATGKPQEKPESLVGLWVFCPAWADVPLLCVEQTGIQIVLRSADGFWWVHTDAKTLNKRNDVEGLHVEDDFVIGKNAKWELATGKKVPNVQTYHGPKIELNVNPADFDSAFMKFHQNMVQCLARNLGFPASFLLTQEEIIADIQKQNWLDTRECVYNPKGIKPKTGLPLDPELRYVINNGRDLYNQHVYRTIDGITVRAFGKPKRLRGDQMVNAQWLPIKFVCVEKADKLKWLLEETTIKLYTTILPGNGTSSKMEPCQVEYLCHNGRICWSHVAIWQGKNFSIKPVDEVLNRIYYVEVET